MVDDTNRSASDWRTVHGDLSDEEWALIAGLVPDVSAPGKIGRSPVHPKRDMANAIMYVAATGCRWRVLPACSPHWNTVHRYHVR